MAYISIPPPIRQKLEAHAEWWVLLLALILAACATAYSYAHGSIIAYGDAESHLNIAKRVIDSLTPGFAQLGGIWLPLPHLLMVPFVASDFLWRSGLAGSIVAGGAYIVSSLYIYKLTLLLTRHKLASFVSALVFMTNPNILYMQSTPMTELVLIVFFVLSGYFFVRFLQDDSKPMDLIYAAFYAFCASLSRYDGWALVLMEMGVLFLLYIPDRASWKKLEGRLIVFSTLALFGIVLWLAWDGLILGDPFYFAHSEYSASSQQNAWLSRGELPAYHNIWMAVVYYAVTSGANIGWLISAVALIGLGVFMFAKDVKHRWLILLVLAVPFLFNIASLFLGQSVIFIPYLTPIAWGWNLFNVRYGIMMVPFAAFCVGYLFYKNKLAGQIAIIAVFVIQIGLFATGREAVLSLDDGLYGLSSEISKTPDVQNWIDKNYDGGLVLSDDYARTVSIIRSPIPMQDVIYVGNKPYWDISLQHPEAYARWIIMQQGDAVWNSIWEDPATQADLFKYFNKAYTSSSTLVFERIGSATSTASTDVTFPPPPPPPPTTL